jgi:hypothetical protein
MEMTTIGAMLPGAIFVAAGAYELTPLKGRCLTHCQSPLTWIPQHMRPGRTGAVRMGFEHGTYCVGCCWALMLLLLPVKDRRIVAAWHDAGVDIYVCDPTKSARLCRAQSVCLPADPRLAGAEAAPCSPEGGRGQVDRRRRAIESQASLQPAGWSPVFLLMLAGFAIEGFVPSAVLV